MISFVIAYPGDVCCFSLFPFLFPCPCLVLGHNLACHSHAHYGALAPYHVHEHGLSPCLFHGPFHCDDHHGF